jgi:hypothetical protein
METVVTPLEEIESTVVVPLDEAAGDAGQETGSSKQGE